MSAHARPLRCRSISDRSARPWRCDMTTSHLHDHVFPTATEGLPACVPSTIVELGDGDTYELRIGPVANRLGDIQVRMLAYQGSIPGPTLRVPQGSQIA